MYFARGFSRGPWTVAIMFDTARFFSLGLSSQFRQRQRATALQLGPVMLSVSWFPR